MRIPTRDSSLQTHTPTECHLYLHSPKKEFLVH